MDERELSRLLREHAARHAVPGAAVAVLRDGEVVEACTGVADVSTGDPVTPATRFAVGSITKSMVATVVTNLDADGQMSLDGPVADHVPELRRSAWAQRATLRDLLANRSGILQRASSEFELEGDDEDVLSRCATMAAGRDASTPPIWSYSNLAWCLLGRALEVATGRSWEQAMQAELFDPVGMDRTVFADSPVAEPRATGHHIETDGPIPFEPWTCRAFCAAGSSVLATSGDLLRFARLHLTTPGLDVLRTTHAEVAIHGWLDAWGLGWGRFDWDDSTVWGWDGLMPGQRPILRLLPDHGAAVALLTNATTGRAMYRSFLSDLLSDWLGLQVPALPLEPAPGAAGDLRRFAGHYAWPDRGCEVTDLGDALRIEVDGQTWDARPLDESSFLIDPSDPDDPAVTFGAFDADGRPQAIYIGLWALPRRHGT
jgi:CubicO group peptidase (beta-lactamase class C family)